MNNDEREVRANLIGGLAPSRTASSDDTAKADLQRALETITHPRWVGYLPPNDGPPTMALRPISCPSCAELQQDKVDQLNRDLRTAEARIADLTISLEAAVRAIANPMYPKPEE